MSADDYKAYLLHRYDSLCVEIDRQPWSEAYKEINRINNAVWCALLLNRYSLSLRLSYRNFSMGLPMPDCMLCATIRVSRFIIF